METAVTADARSDARPCHRSVAPGRAEATAPRPPPSVVTVPQNQQNREEIIEIRKLLPPFPQATATLAA